MPTTLTPEQQDFLLCDHNHTLDNLVGYEVWQTIDNAGELIDGGRGRLVATVHSGYRYSLALALAYAYRTGESYAVVENVYGCGHSAAQYDGRTVGRAA